MIPTYLISLALILSAALVGFCSAWLIRGDLDRDRALTYRLRVWGEAMQGGAAASAIQDGMRMLNLCTLEQMWGRIEETLEGEDGRSAVQIWNPATGVLERHSWEGPRLNSQGGAA